MDAAPFRRQAQPVRRGEVGRRSEPGRRGEPLRRADVVPRRADAPLRKPEPNLRRPDGVVRRPTLAVDIGSCGSSVILVTSERDQVIDDPDVGHPVWPTTVAHDGVAPRVGGAAENFSRVHPHLAVSNLKQLLAEPGPVSLGEQAFAPADLVAWLLAGMRAQAEKVTGVDATRAVLTVPVSYTSSDARRQALLDAAARAGLTTVELLAEPLAVLSSPLIGGPPVPGDIVLVCDVGAGAFTTTLANMIKGGTVELLGSAECPEFSGREIDRLIMAEMLSRAGRSASDLARSGDDPAASLRTARARRRLTERVRSLKHQLSAHDRAVELVGPDETVVEFTVADLTTLVAPLLHRALTGARQVLTDAGVRTGEVAFVLLSGGGSRMPIVEEMVTETFRRPVRGAIDPGRAAVEGAARFARTVEQRHVRARVATERETPLRWDLPDGEADDLRWLIPVGARFGAADAIATVRLADGSLWELRTGRTGTLVRTHLPEGSSVSSGDWLVTVELDVRPFR